MAATVHTGKVRGPNQGNQNSYTYNNDTGGNVRVIIYWFYGGAGPSNHGIKLRFGDLSGDFLQGTSGNDDVHGKYVHGTYPTNLGRGSNVGLGIPTEFVLADGHGFYVYTHDNAAWCEYNIVTIPE